MDLPDLSAHMLTVVPSTTCGKQYSSKKALVLHIKVHNPTVLQVGEHSCLYADYTKVFNNPKSRQDHVAYCLHNPNCKGPFTCLFEVCDQKFT